VRLIIQNPDHEKKVIKILTRAEVSLDNIEFVIQKTDRSWMRDTAPAFVKADNKVTAVNFKFNGWAKYDNWQLDKKIPSKIIKTLGVDSDIALYKDRPVVLEGGSIDSNGAGTLIATEECLLDPLVQVRNPGFSKTDYEHIFKQYLGITNIIWLGQGVVGDDTHGHVDDLCRFVNKNTVVVCCETNQNDKNYLPLRANLERLKKARLENGQPLNVVELPMPAPVIFEGMRLPASYANFYICNNAVLVPTFNDPNDRIALNILAVLFPERKVVGIHAVDLVWGLGTIHCLSHEVPS
jgi:agmatine deiminase